MRRRQGLATTLRALPLVLVACLMAGCGSTKVITAEKSLVYRGSLYSLSNVSAVTNKLEAMTSSGETIDVLRHDKRAFNALLKQYDTVTVRSTIMLDDREVLYEQTSVDSYRGFSKLQNDLEDAMEDIQALMADPKKTQLEL